MDGAARFVSSMMKKAIYLQYGICPFQFDMVVAMGEAQRQDRDVKVDVDDEDDDTDDDDESDDEKETEDDEPYTDFVGNVEDKLMANTLKYTIGKCAPGTEGMRIFDLLYR